MTHDNYSIPPYKLFFIRVVDLVDPRPDGAADNKGFTLVELLMVIAIIAGLAAMVIPMYKSYINKAKNSRAMSEIRTMSTEISGYALDHNGANPPDLNAIGRNNFLDPWKRPYVYLTIPMLEDVFSKKLNKDFDIYSKGMDGAGVPAGGDPGNKDDIVRFNDGAYIGLREAF